MVHFTTCSSLLMLPSDQKKRPKKPGLNIRSSIGLVAAAAFLFLFTATALCGDDAEHSAQHSAEHGAARAQDGDSGEIDGDGGEKAAATAVADLPKRAAEKAEGAA